MTKKNIFFGFFLIALVSTLGLFIYKSQPNVLGSKTISPYTTIDPVFDLITTLEKTGIILENTPILSGGTITASIAGSVILFSKDENISTQVRALQLLLPRLRIDNKKVSEVDLRFNKVIIR